MSGGASCRTSWPRTSGERDAAAARLSKAKMRHELSIMRAPADGTVP